MFPFRDHNPSQRTPYVTYALIALNILVFLTYAGAQSAAQINAVFYTYGAVPSEIVQGRGLIGLLTAMFLHAGWMHLGGNMLYLWIFGDNMEDQLGHVKFLGFYLVGGIAASLLHIMADPDSQIPMVGASGAIAAVLGGYLLMFPKARVDVLLIIIIIFRVIPVPAWVVLGVWFALQIFNGVASDPNGGGVAYWAHAGGFVAGLLLILPHWLSKGGPAFWDRTHGHPDKPEARYRISSSSLPQVRRRR